MDTIDDTDEKMEAIGLFLEDLQTSANAETVVRRYATMHPQWVSDFLEEAVMGRMLTMSRADEVLPDLSQLTDFRIIRGISARSRASGWLKISQRGRQYSKLGYQ